MSTPSQIPKAGDQLTINDVEMILEALQLRNNNFPNEPGEMTLGIVLLNIGDRFAPVSCVAGEWEGIKQDIPKSENPEDLPMCPNGHVLTQGPGLKLGWIEDDT